MNSQSIDFIEINQPNSPYWEQFEKFFFSAFPEHERRSIEGMKRVIENENYHLDFFLIDNSFVGFRSYWIFETFLFGEYMVVDPNLRNSGIGQRIHSQYFNRLNQLNLTGVIGEIDPPIDEISIRRRNFFLRLGFVENDHPYQSIDFNPPHAPYQLRLISYPNYIDLATAQRLQSFVHNVVVKQYQ